MEAMLPAARAAAPAARPKRLQIFYTPNGMIMQSFTPESWRVITRSRQRSHLSNPSVIDSRW